MRNEDSGIALQTGEVAPTRAAGDQFKAPTPSHSTALGAAHTASDLIAVNAKLLSDKPRLSPDSRAALA